MTHGIKIAICDDEAVYRENIKIMCMAFFEEKKPSMEMPDIHVFSSGKEIASSGKDYDLLLLDIKMPEQDGINVKEHFETNRKQTRIIFTTSHKERVLEAFGKNVVGFLVKPLCKDSFQKVMEKALSDICSLMLEVEESGETYIIPVKQIKYIEAQDKYTLAVTETREYLMRRTMKYWENTLPCQDFARIHKSYLISYGLTGFFCASLGSAMGGLLSKGIITGILGDMGMQNKKLRYVYIAGVSLFLSGLAIVCTGCLSAVRNIDKEPEAWGFIRTDIFTTSLEDMPVSAIIDELKQDTKVDYTYGVNKVYVTYKPDHKDSYQSITTELYELPWDAKIKDRALYGRRPVKENEIGVGLGLSREYGLEVGKK